MSLRLPWRKEPIDGNSWLQETLAVVFDPATGSPFWLDYAKEKGIDARRAIHSVEDLALLGSPEELTQRITRALTTQPLEHFIPASILTRGKAKLITSVTGGTTGPEKNVVYDTGTTWYSAGMHAYYFLTLHRWPTPADMANVLYIGPTGNHILGKSIMKMAEANNGFFFTIDLDPRIIKKYIAEGATAALKRYKEHIFEQTEHILASQQVDVVVTTSKLLPDLAERFDLSRVKAVLHGGTSVTPDEYRVMQEELLPGCILVGTYGNALFGSAFEIPRPHGEYDLIYYSNFPLIQLEVVHPEEPTRMVEYGERGRVLFRRLTPEIFIPCYLERDEALRHPPSDTYRLPFDGIRNPGIFAQMQASTIEGVY